MVVLLNLLVAFLISFLLIPFNKKFSIKHGAVAMPRERDAHTKPTPRMGGLSVATSFVITMIIFMQFANGIDIKKTVFLILGALVLCIVGVIDDIYQIKPMYKMAGQILAILFAVLGGVNVRFLVVENAGVYATFIQGLNIFGTFFFTLGMINAMNMIDGLDGLSSGITIIAGTSLMILSAFHGNMLGVLLSVTLVGSALGFLAHNFHPASIFIGDTGSMLYGYMLAIIALEVEFQYLNIICLAAPLIILMVPIFDASFAILRRIINHVPISQPDKKHTHHRLMNNGFSYISTVLILYIIAASFGITGIYTSITQSGIYIVMAVVVLIVLITLIVEKKHENKNIK